MFRRLKPESDALDVAERTLENASKAIAVGTEMADLIRRLFAERDRLAASLADAEAERDALALRVESAGSRERAITALNGRAIRALLMCAPHCQGGHSDAGRATADLLDVPFPLTMKALAAKAKALGYDQDDLWPWYGPMVAARAGKGEA